LPRPRFDPATSRLQIRHSATQPLAHPCTGMGDCLGMLPSTQANSTWPSLRAQRPKTLRRASLLSCFGDVYGTVYLFILPPSFAIPIHLSPPFSILFRPVFLPVARIVQIGRSVFLTGRYNRRPKACLSSVLSRLCCSALSGVLFAIRIAWMKSDRASETVQSQDI